MEKGEYYKMKVYINEDKIDEYIEEYVIFLDALDLTDQERKDRIDEHLNENVIIKYTHDWQDEKFKYLLATIMDIPGGYWIVQDYIHMPHVEFEHYSQKSKRSYEKGNVPDAMAKKELPPGNYAAYKLFKNKDGSTDLDIDIQFTTKVKKPKDL